MFFFFFQAEDGIRDLTVTGVQTCALPIAIWLDSTRNRLCIEFVRRKAAMNPGITYRAQFCNDLWSWQDAAAAVITTSIDSIWERVRYEDSVPATQATARFGRVVVTVE